MYNKADIDLWKLFECVLIVEAKIPLIITIIIRLFPSLTPFLQIENYLGPTSNDLFGKNIWITKIEPQIDLLELVFP